MIKESYNVIGVMSGTSLDGVDLAHIFFYNKEGKWQFDIAAAQTVAYSQEWVDRLRVAVNFNEEELKMLNDDYTALLSNVINNFVYANGLTGIDAVCSHGHTVLHQPLSGITLQIGNNPEISKLTGLKVVCDFRMQDVQLGGQGAPLVPIGDRLLFSRYRYCLNLGGFSNISFEKSGSRIAFDICPVNTVLNFYARKLGVEYDAGGAIASKGSIIFDLLGELNAIDFYNQNYPKSLGFEFVQNEILPLMEKYPNTAADKLCTFIEHAAIQISHTIKIYGEGDLLITGGGAYNSYLISRLEAMLPHTVIVIPQDKTIQFKEALIFGLLGVLRLRGEINVLCSVTGASANHSSGKIFEP